MLHLLTLVAWIMSMFHHHGLHPRHATDTRIHEATIWTNRWIIHVFRCATRCP